MTDISISTLTGYPSAVPAARLQRLRLELEGDLLTEGDSGYDRARQIWNGYIDRKPAAIVRVARVEDIAAALAFARETGAVTSIKGGGHNIAGSAVGDGGLMIDLSLLRAVTVDPATGRVIAEPGATLADVDAATAKYGLAVPTGINSTTGIAGLTLGGGFGWLTRAHGLTVDSLVAADVITASGDWLRAAADENPGLFWALRGGGGNFGVVTRFEFQAHAVGPEVLAGLIVLPHARAREAIELQRTLNRDAPAELTVWTILRKAPPLPFLPEAVHGTDVAVLAVCYAGIPAEGEKAIAPLRAISDPIAVMIGAQPFAAWQTAFDPLLTEGARNYWKSHDIVAMSDEAIDSVVAAAADLPGPECEIFVAHVGGALARVGATETAFAQRQPHFVVNVHARWRDAREDAACIAWAREVFDRLKPYSAGVYVNFMTGDEAGRIGEAYGANLTRLAAVKSQYDPENFFRRNQNIAPADAMRRAG